MTGASSQHQPALPPGTRLGHLELLGRDGSGAAAAQPVAVLAAKRCVLRWLLAAAVLAAGPGCGESGPACSRDPSPPVSRRDARRPVAELFPDPVPALPPPARGIAFGMTVVEAKTAVPAIRQDTEDLDLDAFGFGMRLALRLSFPTNAAAPRIVALELLMRAEDLEAVVYRAWGPPTERTWNELDPLGHGDRVARRGRFWFAPTARLRAVAQPSTAAADLVTVRFSPYLTAGDLVGDGPGDVPAFGERWLGASREAVEGELSAATWSTPRDQVGPDGATITEVSAELAATFEWGRDPIAVHLRLRQGRVVGYKLRVPVLDVAAGELVLAALYRRWGAPTEKRYPPRLQVYRAGPEVAGRFDPARDDVTLYVGDVSQVF